MVCEVLRKCTVGCGVSGVVAAAASAGTSHSFYATVLLVTPHRSFQSRQPNMSLRQASEKGQRARLSREVVTGARVSRAVAPLCTAGNPSPPSSPPAHAERVSLCPDFGRRRTRANNNHGVLSTTRLAALSKGRPNKQAIVPKLKTEPTLKRKVAESSLGAS